MLSGLTLLNILLL